MKKTIGTRKLEEENKKRNAAHLNATAVRLHASAAHFKTTAPHPKAEPFL